MSRREARDLFPGALEIMMYTPVGGGWAVADVRFALHSNRTTADLTGPVKRAMVDAGVTQPVTAIESLGAIADATLARERLLAELASWFGMLALVLACIGLYGTMSFAVARRTNEIGTRLALGATRARIIGGLMRPMFPIVRDRRFVAATKT